MFEEGHFGDVRYDLFERRRRRIISDVLNLSSKGPEAESLEKTSSPMDNSIMMDAIHKQEQANIETLRRMGKKESENFAILELEQQMVQHNSMKKQEESQQRIRDLMKAREEKMVEVRKIAEKKAEKNQQVRERAERTLQEHSNEIMSQLLAGGERAQRVLDGRETGWAEMRRRNKERQIKALEAKDTHEGKLMRGREGHYGELCQKDEHLNERLDHLRVRKKEFTDAFAKKRDACVERSRLHLQKRQDERDSSYMTSLDKHQKAMEQRDEALQSRVKYFADKNNSERKKYEARTERTDKERAQAFEKAASAPDIRQHTLSPEALAYFEHRRIMRELADMNQAQLARAHEYTLDEALLKIEGTRNRVQQIVENRDRAAKRRMIMVKNVAHEKFHLSQRFERLKDCHPSRMSNMLADMDPEPNSVEKINNLLTAMNLDLLPGTHKADDEGDK